MLNELKRSHPTLELGSYYHSAGSMHIYDRHYKMLDIDFDAIVPEHDKKYLLTTQTHKLFWDSQILK